MFRKSCKSMPLPGILPLLLLLIILPLWFQLAGAQQVVRLWVPYHSQIPPNDPAIQGIFFPWTEPGNANLRNGFCTCACIDMLFNYHGDPAGHGNPPLPQQEIAAVANTNDPIGGGTHWGTYLSDARRAVHFSSVTAAWPSNPPLR